MPALERLLDELRATKATPDERVTLVHGDAKPGNFAFVNDDVSAVFDCEMTTLGDPLTALGWLELPWMQPVGLTRPPRGAGDRRSARALYRGQRDRACAPPMVSRAQRVQDGRHLPHRLDALRLRLDHR
jgi:aminoglycoside phosphotransferase (APT) family kinase protein